MRKIYFGKLTLIHINTRPLYIDSFQNRDFSPTTATKNEIKIEVTRNILNIFIIFYEQRDL